MRYGNEYDLVEIKHSHTNITRIEKNGLANLTGVICDGAKPSCAIKIASSIDAAFMSHQLAIEGKMVESGTGIIYNTAEETINSVADIASKAMTQTDDLIIKIMVDKNAEETAV